MKIIFIGAGNLATQLSKNLQNKGFEIIQIYSRSENSAKKLAGCLSTNFTTDLNFVFQNADLYFITVNDLTISEIVQNKNLNNKFLVHCAGSVDINVFENFTSNFGVFYPLQTFSKLNDVDFIEIPICVEANTLNNLQILKNIATKISNQVYDINSEQRKYIHLAAVFANNFSTHFINISKKILDDKNIDSKILYSLINETIENAFLSNNQIFQTGPAARGDINVVNSHLKLLKDYPKFEKLYRFVSKNINEILDI